MYKILYISETDFSGKNGHDKLAKMHHKILLSIFGHGMYTLYLQGGNPDVKNTSGISNNTYIDKINAIIHGYPAWVSQGMLKQILEIIKENKIDIVYFEDSTEGRIIRDIKKLYPKITIVAFYHDIEYQRMKELMKYRKLHQKILCYIMMKNEKMTVKYADFNILLNLRDSFLFSEIYHERADAIIPIILPDVDISDIHQNKKKDELNLLFVGVDYWPNINAVDWFLEKVIPYVPEKCKLTIVGYNMEKYRQRWEISKKVEVVGTVDDLKRFYIEADVVIAPIFEGGGMKVKTAEALLYGKRLIGLPEAFVGYWDNMPTHLKNRSVFKCENGSDFLDAINMLYGQSYFKCDEAISSWANDNYTYSAARKMYITIFDNINQK